MFLTDAGWFISAAAGVGVPTRTKPFIDGLYSPLTVPGWETAAQGHVFQLGFVCLLPEDRDKDAPT